MPLSKPAAATHVDVFLAQGGVNRMLLASPPAAKRCRIGDVQTTAYLLTAGKEFTIYELPKRLDPAYRIHCPPMTPVTMTVHLASRQLAQEFRVQLTRGTNF